MTNDDLVTVILKQTHTHGGKVYQAGDTLRVNAAMRDWLINQGIIQALVKQDLNRKKKA